ncbi:MAG: hypothetical protein GY866_27500 [Proteobacteria bacterium]|nr:hypothetical protein [Pseudomonadota bacterium]
MEGKSSADPLQQLKWVQEQLLRIQAVCAKTLNKAPHLKEIIYDFSELADTLLIVTGKAIQLHQLVDAYYSEDSIEFETKTIVNLLLEVARTRDNILVQVKELIEYYNDLAEWTEQISGMENKKLPYDTYRYMQTLKRYIETEQTTTEQQLIGLQYYSQSEVQSVIQISVHSKHSAKQKYLEIQQVVGRVVKCYIALAGHTQLSVTPIVESAYEVVELISCPTCRFVLTTLQSNRATST